MSFMQSVSANLIVPILGFLIFLIVVDVIISWLISFKVINMKNPTMAQVVYTIHRLADPLVAPIRKVLPAFGGLDFSPIVAFFILRFLSSLFMPGGPIYSALG